MRYLVILAILLANTTSLFATDEQTLNDEKLADLLFPSEHSVKLEQFPTFTAAEFNLLKEAVFQQLKLDEMCFVINHNETPHKFFNKYDLSGDGIVDVILSDYCGAMEIRTLIWLRKGDSAEYAGFIGGTPLKIYRNRKSDPFSIVVNEGWCCARNLGSIRLYKLAEDHGRLEYKLEKRIMQFKGVTVPSTRMSSVFFKVKHDKYRLRSSPEILDQPGEVVGEEMIIGNIIAEFPKGSSGEAIAEYRDKTGRVWWFVLMDKNATTTINHFYDDKDSYKMGWMSSRYLEVVK